MEKEIWKTVDDFPNYEVSNLGNVRNKKTGHFMKQTIGREGSYLGVYLSNNGKENTQRVHRLVAEAFLGKHPGLMVNHIDGNKLNNHLDNLEWCTAKENNNHAIKIGLNKPGAYQKRPIRIVETGEIFDGVVECAEAVGGDFRNVYRSLNSEPHYAVNGLHFEYADNTPINKPDFLYPHQREAVEKMFDGCILNGGVGSGKSRAGLYYYFTQCGGERLADEIIPMKNPLDLYIITTAKKRNDLEWEPELNLFLMSTSEDLNQYDNKIIVDSWQNIGKYTDVQGAYFIFDEDHVTGNGAWVKAFYKIAKKNRWFILSASPGDKWEDFIAVFVANGFYRNKSEFIREHITYSPYITKYPKVQGYRNTGRLIRLRNKILIDMDYDRHTVQHHEDVYCSYDIPKYKDVMRKRWDPYKDAPIEQPSALCYILRRVVNSDENRQMKLLELMENIPRAIIFYNFDYEREILLKLHYGDDYEIAEWSGHAHEPIPDGSHWVYLVQYTAGCEGFNCIKTNTIIFYSQNYSYKTMIQAAGRVDRLNSPYMDLYYYHLKSRSGIDLAISRALSEKRNFNEMKFVNGK